MASRPGGNAWRGPFWTGFRASTLPGRQPNVTGPSPGTPNVVVPDGAANAGQPVEWSGAAAGPSTRRPAGRKADRLAAPPDGTSGAGLSAWDRRAPSGGQPDGPEAGET